MIDSFICRQTDRADGLSIVQRLYIFGVPRFGYYSWVRRKKNTDGSRVAKKEQQEQLKEKFRKIVRKLGCVPGEKTFQIHLWREFNTSINIKRCRKVMKETNLMADRPREDAYKNQATRNHEYSSPKNAVKQNFSVDPRRVTSTDIIYLYYGPVCAPIYLCAFRDTYTKEISRHYVSSRMTVSLVKSACDVMIENYGHELRGAACVVHSDQGSQYLLTTFQRLLSDDGLLQSASDRGNSQDNTPMESLFGRPKCELLNLVTLCPDASTVSWVISGYIDAYSHRHYQYALVGLTPSGYYTYVTTGIYPADNYYDIKATELMPIQALVAAHRRAIGERAKKYRKTSARKRIMAQGKKKNPEFVIARDQHILCREVAKRARSKELALQQISHLKEILELS